MWLQSAELAIPANFFFLSCEFDFGKGVKRNLPRADGDLK